MTKEKGCGNKQLESDIAVVRNQKFISREYREMIVSRMKCLCPSCSVNIQETKLTKTAEGCGNKQLESDIPLSENVMFPICNDKGEPDKRFRVYSEANVKESILKLKEESDETHNCGEHCKGYEDCKIQESLIIRKDVFDKIFGEFK